VFEAKEKIAGHLELARLDMKNEALPWTTEITNFPGFYPNEDDADIKGEIIEGDLMFSKLSESFDGKAWRFDEDLSKAAKLEDGTISGVRKMPLFKDVYYLQEFKDEDGLDMDYINHFNSGTLIVFGTLFTTLYCLMQWFWTRGYLRSIGKRETDGQMWSVHANAGILDLFCCRHGGKYCCLFLLPCKHTFGCADRVMPNFNARPIV